MLKCQQINNYQQLNLKNKQNKQPQQEQNHRYGDPLEGYQLGVEMGRKGELVQGPRSKIGGNRIDRGRLRTV